MPSLDETELAELRRHPKVTCKGCGGWKFHNYCLDCDEFFRQCEGGCPHGHAGHRTCETELSETERAPMPSLTEEDRKVPPYDRPKLPSKTCGGRLVDNFCGQCDEFFWRCDDGCPHDHPAHRTYAKEVGLCPS